MKPARFAYHRAETTEQAVDMLSRLGDDAKILAGGQSLIPMMNFRLARPQALIDVSGLADLSYVRPDGEGLQIGALTTHGKLERHADYPGALDVVADTARWIGHPAIRTRGTIGRSLAHSDPAAEWPVLMTALDATVVIARQGASRQESVETFLEGLFTTTLADTELLVEIRIPAPPTCAGFAEYARRHGDFAIAMAAVAFSVNEGRIANARIVLGGIDFAPVRAGAAESAMAGQAPTVELFSAASDIAATEIDPLTDTQASGAYRRRLVRTLVARACSSAYVAARAPEGGQL